jgi:hypothetical protein
LDPPLYTTTNAENVRLALALSEVTTPTATVAVGWAGTLPYFLGRTAIDLLGKSDRKVAHGPMYQPAPNAPLLRRLGWFFPGHMKRDLDFSIGQLRPDIVVTVWPPEDPEQAPYLRAYQAVELEGRTVYIRRKSRQIRWSRLRSS